MLEMNWVFLGAVATSPRSPYDPTVALIDSTLDNHVKSESIFVRREPRGGCRVLTFACEKRAIELLLAGARATPGRYARPYTCRFGDIEESLSPGA